VKVVIKDQDEADVFETQESLRQASLYLDVYYQLDKYPTHDILRTLIRAAATQDSPDAATVEAVQTQIDLNYSNAPVTRTALIALKDKIARNGFISITLVDNNITEERTHFLESFIDLNKYYQNLKETYGIPIWKSRKAYDFDLLLEPKKEDDLILANFSENYAECQRYFVSVMFTKSMAKDMVGTTSTGSYINYYKAFGRFFICFMVMIKTINEKLKNPLDANSMDEYILDNMLFSFGFTDFKNFPVDYKRKIVQNINELIRHKGTDRIFTDILQIFGFKDINIFKYYLVKHQSFNDDKSMAGVDDKIRFVSHNVTIPSLQEAVKRKEYLTHSFESVTDSDPYWQASKLEIGKKDFNYVNSKYFSIESSFDLFKETSNIAYFINLVKTLRDEYPEADNALTLTATKISDRPIELVDLLVAAQIIVSNYYGIDDTIDFSQESIYNVLSFDPEDETPLNKLVTSDEHDINNPDTQRYVLDHISDYDDVSKSELETIFKSDKGKMANMIALIKSQQHTIGDVRDFKKLQALYESKFLAKFNLREYEGFIGYNQYLRTRNLDLHTYIDTIVTSSTQDEKKVEVLYILSALTEYAKNLDVQFDNRFSDVITSYINRMVSIFKAYTVTLKDFTIFYSYDDSLFFTYFDEAFVSTKNTFDDDLIQINDHVGASRGSEVLHDVKMHLLDRAEGMTTIIRNHANEDHLYLVDRHSERTLLTIEDRFSMEDSIHSMRTKKEDRETTLRYRDFIEYDKEEPSEFNLAIEKAWFADRTRPTSVLSPEDHMPIHDRTGMRSIGANISDRVRFSDSFEIRVIE
jgi:hypothetical protein